MYYAALRPEEAIDLRREESLVSLSEHGWGELRLTHSQPRSGTRWTDSGRSRERRELKHRATGETRVVPVHPELVTLLRDHLELFGHGPGGRIFTEAARRNHRRMGYLEVFHAARHARTPPRSPLGKSPARKRSPEFTRWIEAKARAAKGRPLDRGRRRTRGWWDHTGGRRSSRLSCPRPSAPVRCRRLGPRPPRCRRRRRPNGRRR
jgi:hypothetical protein